MWVGHGFSSRHHGQTPLRAGALRVAANPKEKASKRNMKRHPASPVKLLAFVCKLQSYSMCVWECVRDTCAPLPVRVARCEIDCLCSPAPSRAGPTDSSPPSVSTLHKPGSLLPNADLAVTHFALLPLYRPLYFLPPPPPLPPPHSLLVDPPLLSGAVLCN